MHKKACIIITDAEVYWAGGSLARTSEQLLADLRLVTDHVFGVPSGVEWPDLRDAAARVRALLPEEDEDE
jgi:hypothetical protein